MKKCTAGSCFLTFLVSLLFVCVEPGKATQIYFNDFQNGTAGGEWSSQLVSSVPNPDYEPWGRRKFLGEFGGDNMVTLSLGGLPTHDKVTLSFDTYFIRSWDGNATDYGPDYFNVRVNGGPVLLHDTFSNGHPDGQSYAPGVPGIYAVPGYAPMTGAAERYSLGYIFDDGILGTSEHMDSVYHFDFTFVNVASTLQVDFFAAGLQSIYDESWGLDNVSVSVPAVPEPSTWALFVVGTSLILIFLRKRAGRRT